MTTVNYGQGVNYNRYSDADRDEITYLGAVLRRTSWGAVIAGSVVSISAQMVLTLIGIAIGLTAADVNSTPDYREGFKTAAAAWWIISGTLSLFLGGCVVGRFAGMTRSGDVLLHAFTMWAVTALFGFLVVTSGAGMLYGTSMNMTYSGAQGLGTMRTGGGMDRNGNTDRNLQNDTATSRNDRGTAGDVKDDVDPEEAKRYIRKASWWTLGALVLGISASLAGSWLTAPSRIVIRPPSESADLRGRSQHEPHP